MHRVEGGWHLVGEVALDDADMTQALARLKAAAEVLEPTGLSTKLLIPNDQIRYLALDTSSRVPQPNRQDPFHKASGISTGSNDNNRPCWYRFLFSSHKTALSV